MEFRLDSEVKGDGDSCIQTFWRAAKSWINLKSVSRNHIDYTLVLRKADGCCNIGRRAFGELEKEGNDEEQTPFQYDS